MTSKLASILFAAATIAAMSFAPTGAAVLAERQAREGALLRAYPAIATRNAHGLTIWQNGRPVAGFHNINETGCEGNDSCSLWWFDGVLRLGTGADRRTYAEVFHSNGEGWEVLLIGEGDNPLVFDDEVMPSPDGRYAATGTPAGLTDGYLSIIDWSSPGHHLTATFSRRIACAPLNWQGPDELRVICDHDKTATHASLAVVRHAGDGMWQFNEAGPADWKTHQFVADPDFTAHTETARPDVAQPRSDKQRADDAAYFRRGGYEKLN
jgi:hypothetical protein